MKLIATVFLLCQIKLCHCVNFAHLCGYNLAADTFVECSATNALGCANLCDVSDTCLGFQYFEKTNECNLISAIRNVVSNNNYCSFYMKTTTTPMTILGRSLDTTDQMLQDLLYESKGDCPDGWTVTTTKCTLPLSKAKCAEFASFLSATYSNGYCIMPVLTFKWTCPDDWTWRRFQYGRFCHKVIPRTFVDPAPLSWVEACAQACANIGATFASIHSNSENGNFIEIRPKGTGMAIGLISKSGQITGNSSMSWYDGTKVDFDNWGSGVETTTSNTFPPRSKVFQLTVVNGDDNFWHTNYPTFPANFQNIACKKKQTKTKSLT